MRMRDIERDASAVGRIVASAGPPRVGHAWPHSLVIDQMATVTCRCLANDRMRTDDAHLPTQNIDEKKIHEILNQAIEMNELLLGLKSA